jgi:Flp pilus assembly pilin Flp
MFGLISFHWRRLRRNESGQDLVEFALLAALVAVASGLFLPGLSDSLDVIYSRIASKLLQAGG